MRGLRSTIALLVVLVGLGAYIYFVTSKADDTSSSQDRLFAGLESDSIEELTVRSEAGEVTTLRKQDGAWQIMSPVTARASDMEASGIASALAGLDVTRVVVSTPGSGACGAQHFVTGTYPLTTPVLVSPHRSVETTVPFGMKKAAPDACQAVHVSVDVTATAVKR